MSDEETLRSFNNPCKKVKTDLWRDVEQQDKERKPYDIDGLSAYGLVSPNRNLLKDGWPER